MATVLVINGRNEGEWYTLGEHAMVFGRDDSLLAVILDPCVSRRHLEVRYDDVQGCYYAIDVGSRNGVIINGDRVREFHALRDGDGILIGHTLLVFTDDEFDDADAANDRIAQEQERFAALIEDLARKDRAYRERMLHATQMV